MRCRRRRGRRGRRAAMRRRRRRRATGPDAAMPTRMSTGPPGRYPISTRPNAANQSAATRHPGSAARSSVRARPESTPAGRAIPGRPGLGRTQRTRSDRTPGSSHVGTIGRTIPSPHHGAVPTTEHPPGGDGPPSSSTPDTLRSDADLLPASLRPFPPVGSEAVALPRVHFVRTPEEENEHPCAPSRASPPSPSSPRSPRPAPAAPRRRTPRPPRPPPRPPRPTAPSAAAHARPRRPRRTPARPRTCALRPPGRSPIGADNPAYPPYFARRDGGNTPPWEESDFTGDPTTGEGFESAVAYAVADKLGYRQGQGRLGRRPVQQLLRPGRQGLRLLPHPGLLHAGARPGRRPVRRLLRRHPGGRRAQGQPDREGRPRSPASPATQFGAQVGTTSYDTIVNTIEPTKEPQVFDTNDLAIEALKNGPDRRPRRRPADRRLRHQRPGRERGRRRQVRHRRRGEHFCLVLDKDSPLTACVNAAIAALNDDGTLARPRHPVAAVPGRRPGLPALGGARP